MRKGSWEQIQGENQTDYTTKILISLSRKSTSKKKQLKSNLLIKPCKWLHLKGKLLASTPRGNSGFSIMLQEIDAC